MSHISKPLPSDTQPPALADRSLAIAAVLTERLQAQLTGFGSVEWTDSTPSTNLDLTRRARQADSTSGPLPWLRGAREQTAGKGRAGRPWQNTMDSTLMFSCAFAPDIALAHLPGLAPALGVAACEALRQCLTRQFSAQLASRLGLKWPNDLQWRQDEHAPQTVSKLAGILVETAPWPGFRHPIVVAGIGLNLFGAEALSAELGRPIADWAGITQQKPDTETAASLITAIAQAWQQAIQIYAQGGFAAFQQRYSQVDDLLDIQVQLLDQDKVLLSGTACGTDAMGRLLIQAREGVVPVMTGDVSVRTTTGSAVKAPPRST